jgi:hypothetical protein
VRLTAALNCYWGRLRHNKVLGAGQGSSNMRATKRPASSRQDLRSKALVDAVRNDPTDLDIPRGLLENRADVNFNNAEALRVAINAGAVPLVQLLINQQISGKSVNTAFRAARGANLASHDRAAVFLCFSNRLVSQENLNGALEEAITEATANSPTDVVEVLLGKGADPNYSNFSLVSTASRKGNPNLTGELVQRIDIDKFIPYLFKMDSNATAVYQWLDLCWSPPYSRGNISDSRVLLTAIERYPSTSCLVTKLLEHGCNAGYQFKHRFRCGSSRETITVLQWALDYRHPNGSELCDDVILALLEDGQQGELHSSIYHEKTLILQSKS